MATLETLAFRTIDGDYFGAHSVNNLLELWCETDMCKIRLFSWGHSIGYLVCYLWLHLFKYL